jgi:hypothetical protein
MAEAYHQFHGKMEQLYHLFDVLCEDYDRLCEDRELMMELDVPLLTDITKEIDEERSHVLFARWNGISKERALVEYYDGVDAMAHSVYALRVFLNNADYANEDGGDYFSISRRIRLMRCIKSAEKVLRFMGTMK